MRAIRVYIGVGSIIFTASIAVADESSIELKPAAGRDAVEGNCAACHSLDYIQMNSPIQGLEGWTKTVDKMVKTFGAPIVEGDQKAIVEYLAANYGK